MILHEGPPRVLRRTFQPTTLGKDSPLLSRILRREPLELILNLRPRQPPPPAHRALDFPRMADVLQGISRKPQIQSELSIA